MKQVSDHSGLGAALRTTHRLYMRLLQDRLSETGVSVAQYLHLRVLWEVGGLTQVEISNRLGIEKASSTSTIDALEKQGLIERFRDDKDRRRVRVFLSASGKRLCETALRHAAKVADIACDGASDAEVKAVKRWLARAAANLEVKLQD